MFGKLKLVNFQIKKIKIIESVYISRNILLSLQYVGTLIALILRFLTFDLLINLRRFSRSIFVIS